MGRGLWQSKWDDIYVVAEGGLIFLGCTEIGERRILRLRNCFNHFVAL